MQRKESSCFDLIQTFGYLKHFHDNKYRIDKIFHTFLSLAFTNHNPIDGKCDYSIMLLTNNELIWNINYTQNTIWYKNDHFGPLDTIVRKYCYLLFVYLLPHGLMIMWTRIWDMTKTRAFVTEICTILLQQVRILYLHNQCIHAISRKLAMFDVVLNILF